MANLNILSQRYATNAINEIFSEHGKNLAERELWIAVMKAQKEFGVDIPGEDIEKFERAKSDINLARIEEIERETRHDIKAKIQAFVEAAGAGEYLHMGMTSRDLTDNVEQMQFLRAAKTVFGKYISVLRHMTEKADHYRGIVLTARTHHQPAQPTLLGRRFAMWAEELMQHLAGMEHFINNYPLRGIKGPVGTQFDMLTLLHDPANVDILEAKVAEQLGFSRTLFSTGQVYPRSLDYELVTHLSLLGAACENFAKGMRLMSGYELVTEGFKEGQVGSSAMPHKMNTRSSERICGFAELLKMYADGASRLSGDQWEEGDVSCSVMRRIVLPDAFYSSDGLCETALTVLNEMGAYPVVIDKEVDKYLPFLATTQILMTAVQAGMGREEAHKLVKKYAVAEALAMRQEGREPQIAEKLAADPSFQQAGITRERLEGILKDKLHFIGKAGRQIDIAVSKAETYTSRFPNEAAYEPGNIL
ncbi:adenylosuccinate lyase [Candidatus Woesearchaeota archaeon]|nr:adenylosuccinate lyase [Candidatus Woesearchaeota archaeon]